MNTLSVLSTAKEEQQHLSDDMGGVEPFMLNEETSDNIDDDDVADELQADETAPDTAVTADRRREEHEAKEAARRAEWETKQAAKRQADEQVLQKLQAMSDDDVMGASAEKLGRDAERLTRRNMKMCVTEYIQTICLDNPAFARRAMHPRKSLINCLKYINRHALEYMKQEMEYNGEKQSGGVMGGDVPDDLCYKWAEDYFNDSDAEEDRSKDDKFEPRPFYGGSSSKAKKKEPAKSKQRPAPKASLAVVGEPDQLTLGGVAV